MAHQKHDYGTYPAPGKYTIFTRVKSWYAQFERPISSISLVGGFVFDAVTLKRVDLYWDNLWVIGHLAIVTVCAIWINILNDGTGKKGVYEAADPNRLHFWLVNIIQFFFGGILSTYLVFYFRSGTFATSWPFLLLLAAAFIANESLKRSYARTAFQFSLLFLAYYAFAIYLMPILLHRIGTLVFILSGAVSLAIIRIIALIPRIFRREKLVGRHKWLVIISVGGIFIAVNSLYFLKLIPPLPLSLEDAGIYNSLIVNGPGNYTVTYENTDTKDFLSQATEFLKTEATVHVTSGETLYAYTAVFSPTALNTDIVHVWQYYNATSSAWETRGSIILPVVGGRTGGYRTYSNISGLDDGSWRVNVETPDGRVIGRLNFEVFTATTPPETQIKTIQ
ncbi:MAG: DUF2914 domain-containing protein [Patescibacteria group bacterium]|nr:DUF2914 domain-containing protein [Patescibacteria group bacterium]MDE2015686.1 DUF2914 domain-containing protein [Patescibacteria group bacterium]MDE2226743.1 DUF2914 domain-containing protein [Patescibacteria group bacterium]